MRDLGSHNGQVSLALLLMLRNLAVAVILLAATVAIVAIASRRGVDRLPTAFTFDQPGQRNPFTPAPEIYIPRAQTWTYADLERISSGQTLPVRGPISYSWYCGCKDSLDPAQSSDLFTRSDPHAEVSRRELRICPPCQAALDYLDWKEVRPGR